MANYAHFSSLRPEIRKLLNRVFDDANLDAFCQDYFFEEVYDKFGRGQGKQEKLNVLLGYCRSTIRFEMLLWAMHKCQEQEFFAFFQAKGIVIGAEPQRESVRSSQSVHRTRPPYEVASAYHFDLIDQIDDCLNSLWGKDGLVGFVVPCSSPSFLQNFGERLKYELGRNSVRLMPPLAIDPIRMSINRAILTIRRQYRPALRERDVLFTVRVPKKEMVSDFWQGLQQALKKDKFKNRLIVIIALGSGGVSSDGALIPLKEPHFKIAHVHRWVRAVVSGLGWPDDLFQYWTAQMIAECSHNDELQIEWVYAHLDAIVELLQQHPTVDHFQQELEQRRQLYVSTSP
ncbi:MAG: hypothetical protein ACPGWR_03495 [Ardenticatenaceae bacterium]